MTRLVLLAALFSLQFFSSAWASSAVADHIRSQLEGLQSMEAPQIAGASVFTTDLLAQFYAGRDFQPAWSPDQQQALLAEFRLTDDDGLLPADYHVETLAGLIESDKPPTPVQQANIDLLLSEAVLRLSFHLAFGKVNPGSYQSEWKFYRSVDADAPMRVLNEFSQSQDIAATINQRRPQSPVYKALRAGLVRYQEIAANGGWPVIDDGPALKPGDTGKRVAQLRARLEVTEPLPATVQPDLFDAALENAVKTYQVRQLLNDDGIAGKATIAFLNTPVEQRIDQIRANLERGRWVLHNLPDDFIMVDIAGFQVHDMSGTDIHWTTRAQVGKPYRKTPVFKSKIDHLVINPTWTVPPTILRKDILPKRAKDPDYLKARNIRVLDHSGNPVDEDSIDWSRYPAERFPYMLRQDPGPRNALGRIKFMFPNPHLVYLHDTPSRSLFGRDQRAFSSGCIRVQEPFDLAERLLNGQGDWTKEKVLEVVDGEKLQTVRLAKPKTVVLFYWTATARFEGDLGFKEDIYGRDAAVIEGLNEPARQPKRLPFASAS